VKFLSNDELASASTDSTLRLWDVKQNIPVSNLNQNNSLLRFDYSPKYPSFILHLICRFLLAFVAYFNNSLPAGIYAPSNNLL
jgi:WD40 repeat protein